MILFWLKACRFFTTPKNASSNLQGQNDVFVLLGFLCSTTAAGCTVISTMPLEGKQGVISIIICLSREGKYGVIFGLHPKEEFFARNQRKCLPVFSTL